jgi:hypothetical protein
MGLWLDSMDTLAPWMGHGILGLGKEQPTSKGQPAQYLLMPPPWAADARVTHT